MVTIDTAALAAKYQCTCSIPGEYVPPSQHDNNCGLYMCDEWVECFVEWENTTGTFYTTPLGRTSSDDLVLEVDDVLDSFINDPDPALDDWSDDDKNALTEWWTKKSQEVEKAQTSFTSGKSGKTNTAWKLCSHEQTPVTFPDGTTVYCHSVREKRDWVPDYALYMDPIQLYDAESVAYFLPWEDYGLPTIDWDNADALVEEVFDLARNGMFIEIGCYGAHGRTGVVLGIMAILAGVPTDEAVKWVRDHYCKHAIEGREQEWYVQRFGAIRAGLPVPERPPKPKPLPKTVAKAESSPKGETTMTLPAKKKGKKKRRNRKRGRRR